MTDDQEIRIKCIELAQISAIPDIHLVDLAQKYYWFITAKDKEEN